MELKSYQQTVIEDLEKYLDLTLRFTDLRESFREYWRSKGVAKPLDYQNNVARVPHVCVKVPTAGGKTFIAANAVRPIFDALESVNPNRAKVVIWLVPSLTILDQTVKNLSDPTHPYRQKLQTHFNGRVGICTKQDVLQGADFSPDAVRDQLSIIVLSFDSLRTQNKEGRKVYQENGYLAAFAEKTKGGDFLLEDTDETALINVLRSFEPVLIVDESHNATTNLSVQMLGDLNPAFILDLTATPRDNSNIISYVDALQLKKQNMVKLPVIASNFGKVEEVIESAWQLRNTLEQAAKAEEEAGGKYIRPIVLFQAQPRTGEEDATTVRIKEQLIEYGIPEDEIKIKIADKNEIKDMDLMDRDCPVRYIITIDALKEGWDCPFAYVLASLANRTSPVAVEQILGRILRQPYVRQHAQPILNNSFVFTASNDFRATLENIIRGLNKAGFSERDLREHDFVDEQSPVEPVEAPLFPGFGIEPVVAPQTVGEISTAEIDLTILTNIKDEVVARVQDVVEKAKEGNEEYQKLAESIDENTFVPSEVRSQMNIQKMKPAFAEDAGKIELPQFYLFQKNEGLFLDEDYHFLENENLIKGFKLSTKDIDINFENLETTTYRLDLEIIDEGNYQPKFIKLNEKEQKQFVEYVMGLPDDMLVKQVKARIVERIGSVYPILQYEIEDYVERVVAAMDKATLRDCLEREGPYGKRIKEKISQLATVEKERIFNHYLDADKILLKPTYKLTPEISLSGPAAIGVTKSLYANESSMNNFEFRVINDIANLDNVAFWHRNSDKTGFKINGFINHYPDFIVVTRSGKILIVETKGDDRDNSDSQRKLRLCETWANRSGGNLKYWMIFDNQQLPGAFKLNDAINRIRQL